MPDFNAQRHSLCSMEEFDSIMAKAQKSHHRYREDMSEMADWLKKKKCPNPRPLPVRKGILPKNLTGREKLPDIVDEVFSCLQLGPS